MRKLAEQKKAAQSSLSQHNINNKIMDAVHAMGDGQNAQYWEGFKRRKPNEAKAIVAASRLNMDLLSDKDAFEVVSTFLPGLRMLANQFLNLKTTLLHNSLSFSMKFLLKCWNPSLKTRYPRKLRHSTFLQTIQSATLC